MCFLASSPSPSWMSPSHRILLQNRKSPVCSTEWSSQSGLCGVEEQRLVEWTRHWDGETRGHRLAVPHESGGTGQQFPPTGLLQQMWPQWHHCHSPGSCHHRTCDCYTWAQVSMRQVGFPTTDERLQRDCSWLWCRPTALTQWDFLHHSVRENLTVKIGVWSLSMNIFIFSPNTSVSFFLYRLQHYYTPFFLKTAVW